MLRGSINIPKDITLVALDNELYNLYQKPLPRKVLADVFEKLVSFSPRALFLDLSFVPDSTDPRANERIASAIAKVPTIISSGEMHTEEGTTKATSLGIEPIIASATKWLMPMDLHTLNGVVQSITVNPKEKELEDRVPMTKALNELIGFKSLSPCIFDLINYYGPPGSITRISAKNLLDTEPDKVKSLIENKLVFVGTQNLKSSNKTEKDEEEFPTTYSNELMYGVEIHATIAGNLLNNEWIRVLDPGIQVFILMILVFVSSLAQLFLSPKKAYLIYGGILVSSIVVTYVLFSRQLLWISIVPSLVIFGILSVFIVAPLIKFISQRLDKLIDKRMGF